MKKNNYQPIIGLEIHIELKTRSKMFCRCPADHFGKPANSQTCPVCLGLPGALPYPNQKAIDWTIMAGLALGCRIPLNSKFDRKNYFYPDLPKGFQISQYDQPLAIKGELDGVRIRRVHLEEDTAKMLHRKRQTLIDFNRSGVPLMEIVTEPDIHSDEQAKQWLKHLQQIIRRLGISSCDMAKGSMRIEPNISLAKDKIKLPNYKVEIKNINSFRFTKKAINYEIKRQANSLTKGQKLVQETRGWDNKRQTTYSQRTKEAAHDYRYFPEPDLPPMQLTKEKIAQIRKQIPELPAGQKERWQKEFGLNEYQARVLTNTPQKAAYFEEAAGLAKKIPAKTLANLIINNKVNIQQTEPKQLIKQLLTTRPQLAEDQLSKIIQRVIKQSPKPVTDFQKGKIGILEFLVGQVMIACRQLNGQADPNRVRQLIKQKLIK